MSSIANNLFNFIRNPDYTRKQHSWKEIFVVFIINLIIIIILWFLNHMLISDTKILQNNLFDQFKKEFPLIFILGTTIIPIYEEFLYRIYLTTSKQYLLPILIVFLLICFSISENLVKTIINILYFIFLCILLFYHFKIIENPKLAVYGSSLFFSLYHIFNYKLDNISHEYFILLAFSVTPQFIGGLLKAYIRIRFGFWYAVFYHCMWNLILMLLLFGLINYFIPCF